MIQKYNLMIPMQVGESAVKSILRPRVWLISGIIGVVYVILLIKIFFISLSDVRKNSNGTRSDINNDVRGNIYDAKGVLIAGMLSTEWVIVNPSVVKNAKKLTRSLVAIFSDVPYADMYDKVTRKSSRVLLQKHIDSVQYHALIALGDTYGQEAVVVDNKTYVYVDTDKITDMGEIVDVLAKIFTNISYDQIYNTLQNGIGKVLLTDNLNTSEWNSLKVISELYKELFSFSDKKYVYIKPRQVTDSKGLSKALLNIFPQMSYEDILQKVEKKLEYVLIKRRTTPQQQYDVNAIGDPAITFDKTQDRYMRIYPQEALFSHVLGYVDVDNNGISGIEKSKNTLLKVDKQPLHLTMDTGVQHIVTSEMSKIIEATDATGGVAIVMNVTNGEVVSMVSMPDFNPNHVQQSDALSKFNRATMGLYELGSTFKIINSAMTLGSGLVKISDTFDARKPLRINHHIIKDYHAKNRVLDVSEIFIYSSNIGAALMAKKVGTKKQKQMMEKLNFLNQLQIVLPEKAKPLYPSQWRQVETMTIAYGHGISVTPLHLTAAVASLINGGMYHTPKFIKSDGNQIHDAHRVVSTKTSDAIRKLMRLNTLEGSGRKSAVKGFVLGGKTGTANQVKNSVYDEDTVILSYIAGFPMHAPKYVVYVMVDAPKSGELTSGQVAAPTVHNIVKRIAPVLGIIPVDENSQQVQDLKILSYEKRKARRKKTS